MCGIAGIRRYGKAPIVKYQLDMLLCSMETRGRDASGVALGQKDGTVCVFKNDEPAKRFILSKEYRKFLADYLTTDTIIALLHTRAATGQASPRVSKNNHPLFAGKTAVVHNGVISNHASLFSELKLKREADTDTDIVRAILDKEGLTQRGCRTLSKVCGSMAIAAISPEFPGKLLIGKSGNPVEFAATEEYLVWASEKHALHRALRPWFKRFGLPFQLQKLDVGFLTMPSESVYLFDEKGLAWHQELKTAPWTATMYGNVDQDYKARSMHWNRASLEDAVEARTLEGEEHPTEVYVWCTGCKRAAKIPAGLTHLPLSKLQCEKCKKALVAEKPENCVGKSV